MRIFIFFKYLFVASKFMGNISDKMPHARQREKRNIEAITTATIHHSGKNTDGWSPLKVAETTHGNYGNGMAYTLCVEENGNVWQTSYLDEIAWHAKNNNSYTVGICVIGDFSNKNLNANQEKGVYKALGILENSCPNLKHVVPHNALRATECPGMISVLQFDNYLKSSI